MIFLVGFMGSGKSTVGRALARRLRYTFIDLDSRIEEAAGCSIAEIFARFGEQAFREQEARALRSALEECPGRQNRAVIAAGGGAFAQAANQKVIEGSGAVSIWLDAPVELMLERCAGSADERPLARDQERFRTLYRERLPFYARARLRVNAAANADSVVEEILAALANTARAQ